MPTTAINSIIASPSALGGFVSTADLWKNHEKV
jgi:hypothetical protein